MTSPAKVLLLIKRIEVEAVSNGSIAVRPLSIEKSVSVAVDQKRIDRGSEQWFRYSSSFFI